MTLSIIICQVISSSQFKLFLELEPQLREVLQCFYDSRYSHTGQFVYNII